MNNKQHFFFKPRKRNQDLIRLNFRFDETIDFPIRNKNKKRNFTKSSIFHTHTRACACARIRIRFPGIDRQRKNIINMKDRTLYEITRWFSIHQRWNHSKTSFISIKNPLKIPATTNNWRHLQFRLTITSSTTTISFFKLNLIRVVNKMK